MRALASNSSSWTVAIGAVAGAGPRPDRCHRVRQREEQKVAVDLSAANTSPHIAQVAGTERLRFSEIISEQCNAKTPSMG